MVDGLIQGQVTSSPAEVNTSWQFNKPIWLSANLETVYSKEWFNLGLNAFFKNTDEARHKEEQEKSSHKYRFPQLGLGVVL